MLSKSIISSAYLIDYIKLLIIWGNDDIYYYKGNLVIDIAIFSTISNGLVYILINYLNFYSI